MECTPTVHLQLLSDLMGNKIDQQVVTKWAPWEHRQLFPPVTELPHKFYVFYFILYVTLTCNLNVWRAPRWKGEKIFTTWFDWKKPTVNRPCRRVCTFVTGNAIYTKYHFFFVCTSFPVLSSLVKSKRIPFKYVK